MFKLLIVDDEPLVQIGLASMLDWSALGIRLLGTASNGQKAYELIQANRPDIAIVDLRMPVMDGLELIERCAGSSTEFIILTSSEDFHYAQRAIRQGVSDYLIKLELTPELLKEAVCRALERFCQKRKKMGLVGESASDQGSADMATTSLPTASFAKAMLLRLLDRGISDDNAIQEAAAALGLPCTASASKSSSGTYQVAAIRLVLPQDRDFSAKEIQRLYHCSMDLVKEVFSREARLFITPLDPRSFALLLVLPVSPNDPMTTEATDQSLLDGRIHSAAVKTRELTKKYFGINLAVGLGTRYSQLDEIANSCDEAKRAVETALRENRVVDFRQISPAALAPSPRSGSDLHSKLSQALNERSSAALTTAFNQLIFLVRGEIAHFPKAMEVCCRVHRQLLDWIDDDEDFLDSFFPAESDGCKSLYRARDVGQLLNWLEKLRDGLSSDLASRKDSRTHRTVQIIKRYLEDHYSSRTNLASTAQKFRISPNYLSSIFKQTEGIGFSDYLAELRISKAKYLIKTTRLKIYEVAAAVGFEDAYYFSKVFRRLSGLSPSEYSTRLRSGE